jgi:hypothetical protein
MPCTTQTVFRRAAIAKPAVTRQVLLQCAYFAYRDELPMFVVECADFTGRRTA